jgi:Alcohol dehydrogenase transcription factor Myb/SANT-like
MSVFELSQLITNFLHSANSICGNEQKIDRDESLVKLVEVESIIWQRNHPQFKNVALKEQAWGRIALQLGVSSESCTHTHIHLVKSFFISSASFVFFPFPDDVRNDVPLLIQLPTHTSAHKRPISRPIHSLLCLLHKT